jgi:hypothetical protein
MEVKTASLWITKAHQDQFKRLEVTKPVSIDHQLPLTKIAPGFPERHTSS